MGSTVGWLLVIEAAVLAGSWLQHKATDLPWLGCWFGWHLVIPVAIAGVLALWLHRAATRSAGRAVQRWAISDELTKATKQLPPGESVRTVGTWTPQQRGSSRP